jgi:hypothetical protein
VTKRREVVHHFEEWDSIKIVGPQVAIRVTMKIACGAEAVEADNRWSHVTCKRCIATKKYREATGA